MHLPFPFLDFIFVVVLQMTFEWCICFWFVYVYCSSTVLPHFLVSAYSLNFGMGRSVMCDSETLRRVLEKRLKGECRPNWRKCNTWATRRRAAPVRWSTVPHSHSQESPDSMHLSVVHLSLTFVSWTLGVNQIWYETWHVRPLVGHYIKSDNEDARDFSESYAMSINIASV